MQAEKHRTPREPGMYVMHNRITAAYISQDNFNFLVTNPTIIDDLKAFFGFENKLDIKIGATELDKKYNFYGNDHEKTRQLFANMKIRQLLARFDRLTFGIKNADQKLSATYRTRSFQLDYHEPHLIYDISKLSLLFELFGETLKQLHRIGSLNSPDV